MSDPCSRLHLLRSVPPLNLKFTHFTLSLKVSIFTDYQRDRFVLLCCWGVQTINGKAIPPVSGWTAFCSQAVNVDEWRSQPNRTSWSVDNIHPSENQPKEIWKVCTSLVLVRSHHKQKHSTEYTLGSWKVISHPHCDSPQELCSDYRHVGGQRRRLEFSQPSLAEISLVKLCFQFRSISWLNWSLVCSTNSVWPYEMVLNESCRFSHGAGVWYVYPLLQEPLIHWRRREEKRYHQIIDK